MLTVSVIIFSLFKIKKIIPLRLNFIIPFFIVLFYNEILEIVFLKNLKSDSFSIRLIFLTLFIMRVLFELRKNIGVNNRKDIKILFITYLCLFYFFLASNIFLFFIIFELIVIIILRLILIKNERTRIQTGIYLILFSISPGLVLLISINIWIKNFGCFSIDLMPSIKIENLIRMLTILVFLIKTPIFGLHVWLNKAHTQAPTIGSIILARIVLKTRGYGLIRFSQKLFVIQNKTINLILFWAITGAVYIAISCLQQTDIKILIALSSIPHITFTVLSIIIQREYRFLAIIISIVTHGITSPCLFFISRIYYIQTKTRRLKNIKKLILVSPLRVSLIFICSARNISVPPCARILGEFLAVTVILRWNRLIFILILLYRFLLAVYSLHLFSSITLTVKGIENNPLNSIKLKNIFYIISLITPNIILCVTFNSFF